MTILSQYPALEQWLLAAILDYKTSALLKRTNTERNELYDSIMGAGQYITSMDAQKFAELCDTYAPEPEIIQNLTLIRSFDPGIAKHVVSDLWGATFREAERIFKQREQEIIARECAELIARGFSPEDALKVLQTAQGKKDVARAAMTWVKGVPHSSSVTIPMLRLLLFGALKSSKQQAVVNGFLDAGIIGKADQYLTGDKNIFCIFIDTAWSIFVLLYNKSS